MTTQRHRRPPAPKSRRPTFLGLCKDERARADHPASDPAGTTAWGVVILSSGRLSYLQHGVIGPDLEAAEVARGLVDAYRPEGVAGVGDLSALDCRLPLVGYGMQDLLRVLTPRTPHEAYLDDAVAGLPALPIVLEPPPATRALAAALVCALRDTDRTAGCANDTTLVPLPRRPLTDDAPRLLAAPRAFPF